MNSIIYFWEKECNMKDNALSVANYFIDLAKKDDTPLKPLKLMKLVYIAHGYMLAMLNRSVLDKRFDWVEAWKYGPVIPSVYHSFKNFKDAPITEKSVIFKSSDNDANDIDFVEPTLQDEKACKICDFVWKRYKDYSDSQLVTLLHGKGTPWGTIYEEGMNNRIPDSFTQIYYKNLVESLLEVAKNGK
jgi:uncharacterized phage-associated protein